MPLIHSTTKEAREKNIKKLIDEEKYDPKQAVAIAYSTQRAARKKKPKSKK